MKVVKKEELKKLVNETAPKLPENVVFIAGLRKIKDGQVQVEFAQSRSLAGRKASMLALLNAGDARFNSGRTLMRVWLMVNPEGFKETFGIDIAEAVAQSKTAGEDEVVGMFAQAESITVNGIKHPVKIVCKETIDVESLPKSIREQIQSADVTDEIKNRYILQTKEGDRIVDSLGNTIYRRYELSYGEDTDVLVEGKILASELAKTASGQTVTATNTLAGVLAD
jgi:flagellar basal body-associated protein FliL